MVVTGQTTHGRVVNKVGLEKKDRDCECRDHNLTWKDMEKDRYVSPINEKSPRNQKAVGLRIFSHISLTKLKG